MRSDGRDPKPERRSHRQVLRAVGRSLQFVPAIALLVAVAARGQQGSQKDSAAILQQHGTEIIRRFAEVNRYWLVRPPTMVKSLGYTLTRSGGTQRFEVITRANTRRAKLQGVTYSAMLHQLATLPASATVRTINEEPGCLRLVLGFSPAIRGACGNGVEGSWNGYHTIGGSEGFVVIDTNRWVPLEAQLGRLHETFGEFVQLDKEHYAPLRIKIQIGETSYDWRFRVYEPGLWLFDDSFSDGRRLAWVEDVRVNSSPAKVEHAADSSVALEETHKRGGSRLEEFLQANRHWLLPPLEARRGLVYEYRQETPYLERVWFDGTGNILARLESSKENPDRPTRQSLWLADGRTYRGDVNDRFVHLPSPLPSNTPLPPSVQRDRLLQHLAMGLAIDCALTRLAREPDQFWAELRPVPDPANRYLLVLHPRRDARLFTGTMLGFSSWAYMHDVAYERSEILCDAATHRPIEETDYAGSSDLKGHYIFDDWMDDFAGAAPGRIRAIVPHQKNGKDQSLEMTARFRFAKPGLWLLQQVESHFRGEASGSTGRVNVLAEATMDSVEIRQLLEKAKATDKILASIEEAPPGETVATLSGTNWCPLSLKATWADQAWQSARDREKEEASEPVLGVYRARICPGTNDPVFVELDGLSTSSWKEFLTSWTARLEDDQGAVIGSCSLDLKIRAENGPTPFSVSMQIPRSSGAFVSPPARVAVSGTVQRLTGAYHGHGIWYTFLDKK